MAKYREIILKDGRKVFIDNKGNIVESGTFQQPTGKQSLLSLPVDNSVKPAKVDLLNIDLGDTNKSDGSTIVETPVENAVRRTPATPRRRTSSTPVRRTQTSTPAKVVDKRNGSTVTVTAPSKNNPSTLPEVTITSTRTPKDSTKVDTVKTDSIKTAEERKQILAKKTQNSTQQSNKRGNTKSYLDSNKIQEIADRQNAAFNNLGLLDYVGAAKGLTKILTKATPSTVAASKNMFSKMTDSYPLIEKAIRKGNYKEAGDIIKIVAQRYKTNANELFNRFSKEFATNNEIRYKRGIENVKKFIQDVKKGNINKPKSKYDGGTGKQTPQSKKAQQDYIDAKNKKNYRVWGAQRLYQHRQEIKPGLNNIISGLRNNAKRNQPSLLERVNNKISTYLQKKNL